MICPKCKTKNIKKASFCINCCHEFTEEEQEKAYKKTIYYYIEKIEDIYDKISLEFITDHILFKIGSLIIVLLIGIYYILTRGNQTAILNHSSYDVYFSNKTHAYYVLIYDNVDKANVQLYIPNRVKKLMVTHYDSNDKILKEYQYQKKKGISLEPTRDDYYLLTSTYSNKKTENLKLYIYHESELKK